MAACLSHDLVERYVGGLCSKEECRTIEAHSVECEKCRGQIERLQSDCPDCAVDNSKTVSIDTHTTVKLPRQTTVEAPETQNRSAPPQEKAGASDEKVKRDFESMFEGYKIIEQIGAGGGGTVWRAVQLSTRREVALKVLAAGSFASEKARLRFQREVELTARLEHPNIGRIYDSGVNRGVYYYAMELFEGQHLNKYVKYRQLSQREILELMHTICQAVQYAHQRGIIHRDLKPANIIITADGQPHVLDFGLAKNIVDGDRQATVSIDGQVTGTPAYMSPEQAAGKLDAIDTRTDVYSLGAIVYYLLTGGWPCDLSGSYYNVLKSIQEQDPVRPSKIVPRFDGDVEAILLKALAKDPNERYQSASELAHDIHCWLDGLPIVARSVDTVYLLRKFIVRHRTASVIGVLLLIIILSTTFISTYSYSQERAAGKRLESQIEMFKYEARKNLVFANQVMFILFLEFWHDDKLARAQGTVIHFPEQSRERTAAGFLLDPRPFEQKKSDFENTLFADEPSFGEFLIGEYHLKNNNKAAAVEAYNRCLELDGGASEFDDWFKNRATRKRAQLLNNRIPLESREGTGGG
jgi:serine/threonine protein kinase